MCQLGYNAHNNTFNRYSVANQFLPGAVSEEISSDLHPQALHHDFVA